MKKEKYYIDRKFSTIFSDSIYFTNAAYDAIGTLGHSPEFHLSRAAILNLSILPEVAANCLLETLNIPKRLFDEIDKFSPISKFEFYLWEKKKIKLERGIQEIQNAQELQSIRNFMVHPKSKKAEWIDIDENSREADLGKTPLLKIPYSSEEWEGGDPFVVMRVVFAFFDHIFRVLCEYSPGEVQHLLFNIGEYIDGPKHGHFISGEWKQIQKKWCLRMEFLGVKCDTVKNI